MIYLVAIILGGLLGYILALWHFNNSLSKDLPSIDDFIEKIADNSKK